MHMAGEEPAKGMRHQGAALAQDALQKPGEADQHTEKRDMHAPLYDHSS